MNEITLRTMDILSREIGNPVSIYGLVKKIQDIHGIAHYKQVYDEIKKLKDKNEINLTISGRSSEPSLNFRNHLLIDKLSQIELELKIRFLEKRKEFGLLISELTQQLQKYGIISSVGMINPERNAKLNRIELFLTLRNFDADDDNYPTIHIRNLIDTISATHNIRIDSLFIQEKNFKELLKDNNSNIAKRAMSNKILFLNPQNFWAIIKSMFDEKIHFTVNHYDINPAKITDKELFYNLTRLGYKEFGNKFEESTPIRIEYIITAILLNDVIRNLESIPIILAKSETVNYSLLLFLSQKYRTTSKLLGILNILKQFKHLEGVKTAIRNLKALKTQEIKPNFDDLERKMRLYHVIR